MPATTPAGALAKELEWLLRKGATDEDAQNIGADILDLLDNYLARYVAYPDDYARHAHTLWVAHTWLMGCWLATPRLLFISPEAGSGKTRALTVTRHLVPHPDHTADLTPAYLFHSIDDVMEMHGARPTMLYDEFDTVFGPRGRGNHQMRRLIDAGHDRHATVSRQIRGRPVRFPVYAAMALAGNMDVYDVPSTIRTRSVVIRMQRRAPEERVERWNRRTSPAEAAPLHDLLQLWAEFIHGRAQEYIPELPEEIQDRDADVWEALLVIADLAGGHWPSTARVTAVTFVTAGGGKATPSPGMQLLWDVKRIFDDCDADVIFTGRLIVELRSLEESPWTGIKPIILAQMLSSYGIEPRLQRIGERVARGYQRSYFVEAWRRYPPAAGGAATVNVTNVTNVTELDGDHG